MPPCEQHGELERRLERMELKIDAVLDRLASGGAQIAVLDARLGTVEKIVYGVILAILGLIVKAVIPAGGA